MEHYGKERIFELIEDAEAELDIEDVINRATEVYREYDATLPLSSHEDDQETGKYPKAA